MKQSDLIWAMTDIDNELIELAKETPKKRPLRPALRIALIAAVMVVLMTGVVFAARNWDTVLTEVFHMGEKEQALMENSMTDVYATATKNGCTYTIKQIMGGQHCMVVSLDVTLPEDMTPPSVPYEELKTLAEQNGHDWDSAEFFLSRAYGYQPGDDTIYGVALKNADSLIPTVMEEEALFAEAEAFLAEHPGLRDASTIDPDLHTMSYILYHNAMEEMGGDPGSGEGTSFGSGTLYRRYDPETNTLSLLIYMTTDNENLQGRACTLLLENLCLLDIARYYAQPEDPSGEDIYPLVENLLTEPLIMTFTPDYTPISQYYDIQKEGVTVGTMELSPFSAYLSFPQEPDDPNRLAPNRTDYLKASDDQEVRPEIVLKDGTVIPMNMRSGGFAYAQTAFYITEQIFDLEEVAAIRLLDYTLVPTE